MPNTWAVCILLAVLSATTMPADSPETEERPDLLDEGGPTEDELQIPPSLENAEHPTTVEELDGLFAKLRSDDFDVRNEAVEKLKKLTLASRPMLESRIQKLKNEDHNFEQLAAAKLALDRLRRMSLIVPLQQLRRKLNGELLEVTKEIAQQQSRIAAHLEAYATAEQQYDEMEDREAADALILGLRDERECITGELRRLASRKHGIESQRMQMELLLSSEAAPVEGLERIIVAGRWDATLLPVEVQLKTRVTFEFVDLTLEDACEELRAMTGLQTSIDEKLDATIPINLRVTDMDASLAFEWVMRLCDYEWRVENGRVFIFKPGEPDVASQ